MQALSHCPRSSLRVAATQAVISARSICSAGPLVAPSRRAAATVGPRAGASLGAHWQPLAVSTGRRHFHSSFMAQAAADVAVGEAHRLTSEAGWQYLDVRTPQEFAGGHPPQAVNIPVMQAVPGGMQPNPGFLAEVEAKFPDKSGSLAVACRAGPRSTAAVQILGQAGYENLVNVVGGYTAWEAAGLPVE